MLTKQQKIILTYIENFIEKNGFSPSFEEIKSYLGLASKSSVHQHIEALKKKGYLAQSHYRARSLEVLENDKNKLIIVPLLGSISAGKPIEAVLEKETIAISQNKLPSVGEFYALRVAGDSMIDENINNGDIVLVKKQQIAQDGNRVVALIDNNEVTLKKFYKEKDHIRLQPANEAYTPIIINKNRDLKIQGVVVDVIRHIDDKKPRTSSKNNTYLSKSVKQLPLNKVILGDAIKELKKLPNESCDVIVIDPPYNIGKDFGNNIDKRELNEYVSWCKEWIDESIRVMKQNGTMFIYGFSEILAYLCVEIPIQKRWLIWHYTNKNVASLNFWQRSHESIICAWKDKPQFNRDEIREPYTEGFLNGSAGKIRRGTVGRFSSGGQETVYKAHEGGALPRDVIKIPALAGGAGMNERWFLCKTCNDICEPRQLKSHQGHDIMKHPTQKPYELSKKLIKSAMPKVNGVVLVPFVGTGSECSAAKELGQSYIGFEINPDYVKMAEKMIDSKNFIAKLL